MPTLVEPQEQLRDLAESECLGAEGSAEETPLRQRVVLPFLVPLLTLAIVAVLVLNVSRVFLAGDKDAALVMGIVITVAILVGASLIAAAPRLRTSSLAMILGGMFIFVSGAGLVSLGPSLNDGESGSGNGLVNPSGPATSTVAVDAGRGLSFNGIQFTGSYTATKGIVQINYGGDPNHTLAIQDPKYDGFLLKSDAKPRSGKVKLAPGKYTIYCTLVGHEAAGMKATLTVPAD